MKKVLSRSVKSELKLHKMKGWKGHVHLKKMFSGIP